MNRDTDLRDTDLRDLLITRRVGVLATLKRDGRPQLSNVNFHYDKAAGEIQISVTDGRAKTRNLRRDSRASFYVTSDDAYAWTVAEGVAELGPVAMDPSDAAAGALVTLQRASSGELPDWTAFRAQMVSERRLLLRLKIDHVYGQTQADLAGWLAERGT